MEITIRVNGLTVDEWLVADKACEDYSDVEFHEEEKGQWEDEEEAVCG
jgi:hypothetical protein